MNNESDTSGKALRQAAHMNLVLLWYNILALTPVAHRVHGRDVSSIRAAVDEAKRQLVPFSWEGIDRRAHGLALRLWSVPGMTGRALERYNPVPNKITARVCKATNRGVLAWALAYRHVETSLEQFLFQFTLAQAYSSAFDVLTDSGEPYHLGALQVIYSSFCSGQSAHVAQLTYRDGSVEE